MSGTLVDGHIHLWRTADLKKLAWNADANPLNRQFSIQDYEKAVTKASRKPLGFVYVEADWFSSVEDWKGPVEEFGVLFNAATGKDKEHASVGKLILGIVPWAPIPGGADAMERYFKELKAIAGEELGLLKGFRWLLQDAKKGVMVEKGFVEGMKWCGRNGLSFDMTLDTRSNGLWMLDEAKELIRQLREGIEESKQTVVILDHLSKPDLHIPSSSIATSETFLMWAERMRDIASFGKTYIKLSGAFPEIPPELLQYGLELAAEDPKRQEWFQEIVDIVKPWIMAALNAFGPLRTLFASDWPVCTINGGEGTAFGLWVEVVEKCLEGESREFRDRIFHGTAQEVYRIPKTAAATEDVATR